MRHQRFRRGLNLALLAALAWLPLATLTTGTAEANHPRGFYLAALRSVEWKETFCVETERSSMAIADAHARVNATLTWENPDQDWHGLNNWKIEFEDPYAVYGRSCEALRGFEPFPYTEAEIRYRVRDDEHIPDICRDRQGRPYSCAARDEIEGMSWNNEVEWQYFNVFLRTDPMQGDDPWQNNPDRRRHPINHETGHVFGLDDGGPLAEDSPDKSCPQSIMHPDYYGCDGQMGRPYVPPYPWPQGIDFTTVTNISEGR